MIQPHHGNIFKRDTEIDDYFLDKLYYKNPDLIIPSSISNFIIESLDIPSIIDEYINYNRLPKGFLSLLRKIKPGNFLKVIKKILSSVNDSSTSYSMVATNKMSLFIKHILNKFELYPNKNTKFYLHNYMELVEGTNLYSKLTLIENGFENPNYWEIVSNIFPLNNFYQTEI